MALRDLLAERRSAICERWLDAVLAEYGPATAARWRRERDRFANPIGHALATGLPRLYALATGDGAIDERAATGLEEIVRIRTVQDFTPSAAAGFPCHLRTAVRDELSAELADGRHAAELAALDARIERLVFVAFDTYVSLREEMFRLRQEELKRSVASILRRWNGGELSGAATDDVVRLTPPAGHRERR
jgi:RsbRD-like negative regulator of sigma factor